MPGEGGPAAVRDRNRAKANEMRRAMRDIGVALKAGDLDPWVVIAGNSDVEQVARRMTLRHLLLRIPGIGEITLEETCQELGLSASTRLQMLTFEKREALADFLRDALAGQASTQITRPQL
jgi:hypothetical protein